MLGLCKAERLIKVLDCKSCVPKSFSESHVRSESRTKNGSLEGVLLIVSYDFGAVRSLSRPTYPSITVLTPPLAWLTSRCDEAWFALPSTAVVQVHVNVIVVEEIRPEYRAEMRTHSLHGPPPQQPTSPVSSSNHFHFQHQSYSPKFQCKLSLAGITMHLNNYSARVRR
jgi:hypothetical protein